MPKARSIIEKNKINWTPSNLRNFASKNTVERMNSQATDWK